MKNRPSWIIVHHTAVSRAKNNEQFTAVDNYHRSKGWGMIGYHFLIEPSGKIKVGRAEDTPGAHCYQQLMNYRSLGVCLTGNFDIEKPTQAQWKSLRKLANSLASKYNIPETKIVGHRYFAPKSCPGTNISNDEITALLAKKEVKPKYDMELTERLKGMLLLQVEERGRLWYVTNKGKRVSLGTGYLEYLGFMKKVREGDVEALGITNENLEKIPE